MEFPLLPMICSVEGLFMSLLAIRVLCLEKFIFKSFTCLFKN